MTEILPVTDALTIRQEGDRVLLLRNGALVCSMPWQAAVEVGRVLIAKGRQAEEIAKAKEIIGDQTILTRIGFPIGLSTHPKILAEAKKEAEWGDIRRYLPIPGIRSGEAVGTPALHHAIPTPAQRKRDAEFWAKER